MSHEELQRLLGVGTACLVAGFWLGLAWAFVADRIVERRQRRPDHEIHTAHGIESWKAAKPEMDRAAAAEAERELAHLRAISDTSNHPFFDPATERAWDEFGKRFKWEQRLEWQLDPWLRSG